MTLTLDGTEKPEYREILILTLRAGEDADKDVKHLMGRVRLLVATAIEVERARTLVSLGRTK